MHLPSPSQSLTASSRRRASRALALLLGCAGVSVGMAATSPAVAASPAVVTHRTLTVAATSLTPGDFDGDGHPDLIARTPAGELYLYRGNGSGGFLGGGTHIGTGWNVFDRLFSVGDFSGDGHPDLIGRMPGGNLYLYRGNGSGGFLGGGTQIGVGWNIFDKVLAAGDFTGDGHPDLLGRTPAGALYLYRGNGTGGFSGGGTAIGQGWNVFNKLLAPGDFTGDGHSDLMGRSSAGYLYLYRGSGAGGFSGGGTVIGQGWNVFNLITGISS